MSIDFLKKHAQTLSEFAAATSSRALENPDDRWLGIAAENQRLAAREAVRELSLANAQEVGELIDLRFIGPRADGSIALDAFLKIAENLSSAWKAAACRIRHGVTEKIVDKDIADILNLKLAGIAGGSTRVLITGNSNVDLSGESLLQSTLQQTFRLLTASNNDFYDAVDAVGAKAAYLLGETMKAIGAAGLSAEFTWHSPLGQQTWQGSCTEILRLRGLLDAVAEPLIYEEHITGTVSRISDTGTLQLRTSEGKVSIRFPQDLTEKIQRLSIAKPTALRVSTTRYWDVVAKRDVFKRLLIDTEPA